jgi:hypothetical protein
VTAARLLVSDMGIISLLVDFYHTLVANFIFKGAQKWPPASQLSIGNLETDMVADRIIHEEKWFDYCLKLVVFCQVAPKPTTNTDTVLQSTM